MKKENLILGVLTGAAALLGIGMLLLALLIYQSTNKSILAQQTFIGKLQGPLVIIRMADRAMNIFYRGPRPAEALPHYDLRLDPKDLQEIEDSLPKDDVYLSDEAKVWADGTLTAEGQMYPVRARVRGDRFNHWRFNKKSWRLSFEDGNLFEGMKETNLVIPEDRVWFSEVLSAYRADNFGLFHPPMRFVTASINGSAPMLYLEIEHWTKEMLKKQGVKGEVNLYQPGSTGTSYFNPGWDLIDEDIGYWSKYVKAESAPIDSYEELALFFDLTKEGAHNDPAFQARIDRYFDRDKLIKWYALSLLAGNLHIGGDNLRFYFDQNRQKFEPIVWDISLTAPRTLLSAPGNRLWNEVFAVPIWRLAAHRFLWKHIQSGEAEKDLAKAEELRMQIERAAYRDQTKLQSNRQVKADLDRTMGLLRSNIEFLKEDLARSELLVNQRVGEQGTLMTLDLTSRGSVSSLLKGITLPAALIGRVSLLRDSGNGVLDASDRTVPFTIEAGILRPTDETLALLWPAQPPTDLNNVPLSAPHTRHRFFLVGSGNLDPKALPLTLDLRNAVTNQPSNVIGEVLIDASRL